VRRGPGWRQKGEGPSWACGLLRRGEDAPLVGGEDEVRVCGGDRRAVTRSGYGGDPKRAWWVEGKAAVRRL